MQYQLIPDGINDPDVHFKLAKELEHPGLQAGILPWDLSLSINTVATVSHLELMYRRVQVVDSVERQAECLRSSLTERASSAGYTFRCMRCPLHIPLMEWAGNLANI